MATIAFHGKTPPHPTTLHAFPARYRPLPPSGPEGLFCFVFGSGSTALYGPRLASHSPALHVPFQVRVGRTLRAVPRKPSARLPTLPRLTMPGLRRFTWSGLASPMILQPCLDLTLKIYCTRTLTVH